MPLLWWGEKTVKIVRFVLESCTFRFRDYTYAKRHKFKCLFIHNILPIIILYQFLSCFYSITISKSNKNIWKQRRFCWFTSIFLKNIIKRLNYDAFIWKILSISSFSWVLAVVSWVLDSFSWVLYCGLRLSTWPFYVICKKTIFVWTLQKSVKRKTPHIQKYGL